MTQIQDDQCPQMTVPGLVALTFIVQLRVGYLMRVGLHGQAWGFWPNLYIMEAKAERADVPGHGTTLVHHPGYTRPCYPPGMTSVLQWYPGSE